VDVKKLRRVVLLVPEGFLALFDRRTKVYYASRNEAIRRAMKQLMEACE
jgi:metal-responsive CopG/Arc/MetJ family transcriptional regulator